MRLTSNTHIVLLVLPVVSQLHHPVAALTQHPDQSEVGISEALLINQSSPVQLVLVELHVIPQLLAAGPLRLLQGLPLDPGNQSEVRIVANNQSQTWERSRATRKARRRARR